MAAVREYGRPLVEDPARTEGVVSLGVDETAFLAANAKHPTTCPVVRENSHHQSRSVAPADVPIAVTQPVSAGLRRASTNGQFFGVSSLWSAAHHVHFTRSSSR